MSCAIIHADKELFIHLLFLSWLLYLQCFGCYNLHPSSGIMVSNIQGISNQTLYSDKMTKFKDLKNRLGIVPQDNGLEDKKIG